MAWRHIALPDSVNMLVSGQSQSGKSYFTSRLLMNNEKIFQSPPVKIVYSYRHWQPLYTQLEEFLKDKIIFISHVPSEEELISYFNDARNGQETKGHVVFCVDDWMDEICKNRLFLDLVTRIGHHYTLSNIFLVQDSQLGGPMKREILSNIHVNVFMASCRDRASLRALAILLGDYKAVMSAYDHCSEGGRGSYLMIVTHPAADPNLKYRSKIFPDDEDGPVIFKSKKN